LRAYRLVVAHEVVVEDRAAGRHPEERSGARHETLSVGTWDLPAEGDARIEGASLEAEDAAGRRVGEGDPRTAKRLFACEWTPIQA
jgi:hypothetical protein